MTLGNSVDEILVSQDYGTTIVSLTKPSYMDKYKSKNEASVSKTLALFNLSSEG